MIEAALLMSIVCLLVSVSICTRLYNNNVLLREKNDSLLKEISKEKKKTSDDKIFSKGSKAIISDYALKYTEGTSKGTSFTVTYEVDIVDVSEDKVKVVATDFIGNDVAGRDPSNRAGILEFMKDQWISKKSVEVIMDDSAKRDSKLRELLGE